MNSPDHSTGAAVSAETPNSTPETSAPTRPRRWRKLILLGVVAAAVVLAYTQFGEQLTLSGLAQKEAEFREFQRNHPILVYAWAFAIYVLVTSLSLPGAAAMTLILGWLFGVWRGTILVSFASTTGATLAFLFSRYLLRDAIQKRFGERLTKFNRALEREGAFYLFTLRLLPVVPFFVINLVMGVTPVKARVFWWVSQLGMLPGTVVYVYAGSTLPGLEDIANRGLGGILTPQLFIAFVLLGLFPLLAKKAVARFRPAA